MDNSTNEYIETFLKGMEDGIKDSKKVFLCPRCKHREVCKKIDEPAAICEHFLDAAGYKTYSSIYSMFQPIFDWIKFNYPSDGVKFIVDQTSAKMYLEHGVAVFSKEITDCVEAANKFPKKE